MILTSRISVNVPRFVTRSARLVDSGAALETVLSYGMSGTYHTCALPDSNGQPVDPKSSDRLPDGGCYTVPERTEATGGDTLGVLTSTKAPTVGRRL